MLVTTVPTEMRRIALLFLLVCAILACSRKSETPGTPESELRTPAPSVRPADPVPSAVPPLVADTPVADTPAVEKLGAEAPAVVDASPKESAPIFRSRPLLKAWPGRAYTYAVRLDSSGASTGATRLRLLSGPDSMVLSGSVLSWSPRAAGSHPVVLEAARLTAAGDTLKARQAFTVEALPVLSLVLAPLPTQVDKGDSILLDLSGSSFPAWAASVVTARFDFEGDGVWDTPELPLSGNFRRRHAYGRAGSFVPTVEARYLDLETRIARGAVAVVGAVDAVLRLSPDTVEPGGQVQVDASGSRGDGRLVYALDIDGDGRADWTDSTSGRGALPAPPSGRHEVRLKVRNATGQQGRASAVLVSNARPRLAMKVRNPKENMAAPVEVLLEAIDPDDSLRVLRVNFLGGAGDWLRAETPDTAKGPGKWWKLWRHAYGRPGAFAIEGCVSAADGRETCQKARIEIFNAPPVCEPAADVKATLGLPTEIEGKGRDPDGSIVKWEWDLDGDGRFDVASRKDGKVKYTFARAGLYSLTFRVTTADGSTATAVRKVDVRKKWKD